MLPIQPPNPIAATQDEERLEDLPTMLIMARRAWLDEGGEDGVAGGVTSWRQKQLEGVGVDWGQKAEDLSVELAEFMLQPIGCVDERDNFQSESRVIFFFRIERWWCFFSCRSSLLTC